jgi:hypothetical protein
MIDKLLNNFLNYGFLSKEEKEAKEEFKKGEFLLREGQ